MSYGELMAGFYADTEMQNIKKFIAFVKQSCDPSNDLHHLLEATLKDYEDIRRESWV